MFKPRGTAEVPNVLGPAAPCWMSRFVTLSSAPVCAKHVRNSDDVVVRPGVGQRRSIVGVESSTKNNKTVTTVFLDAPLDNWVTYASDDPGDINGFDGSDYVGGGDDNNTVHAHAPAHVGTGAGSNANVSLVAVVASFGSKLFVGNVFNWTEVVQWYGNTYKGVIADNHFQNCNTKPGGNSGANSLGASENPCQTPHFLLTRGHCCNGSGVPPTVSPAMEWDGAPSHQVPLGRGVAHHFASADTCAHSRLGESSHFRPHL